MFDPKRSLIVGLSTIALVATGTSTTSAAPAAEDPESSNSAEPKSSLTRWVELDHPVGLMKAIEATSRQPVSELRLAGSNFGGMYTLSPTRPDSLPGLDAPINRRAVEFNAKPMVTAVRVPYSLSKPDTEAILTILHRLPARSLQSMDPIPSGELSGLNEAPNKTQRRAEPFDPGYPSKVRTVLGPRPADDDPYNSYMLSFIWGDGHTPQLLPDDFGLELGATLYNTDLSGAIRPLCGLDGGDSDTDFYFTTFDDALGSEGGLTGWWSGPADAYPYVDNEITSDSCQENSLEIGIGDPHALTFDTEYHFWIDLPYGTQARSEVSASMSIKTNDCNDLGMDPASSCMGLNTSPNPPFGTPTSYLLLNRDRGHTAPLYTYMKSGNDDPFVLEYQ